jgi:hypothetical protein
VRPDRPTRWRAPGRLVHLAVDQGDVGQHAALLHLQPEVVALTRTLTHATEDGTAAVLHGDVVDEFHDYDGLADAGAAEEAGRADDLNDFSEYVSHAASSMSCRRVDGSTD